MKAKEISILLLILGFISIIPSSTANDAEWDYSNYLYSLNILSYDDPVVADQSGSITVEVGSNTNVVLHIEFKGQFEWGDWTFSSVEIHVEEDLKEVTSEIDVPYKTMIEPASSFYYFVYVTLPEDEWSPSDWGLAQTVTVSPPTEVSHEELVAYMSHLKWLVDMSTLSDGIRNRLFSKLEVAGNGIDSAYSSENLSKLNGAIGSMNSFINLMNSDNEASSYPDSGLWKDQANYIIERMEIAIS